MWLKKLVIVALVVTAIPFGLKVSQAGSTYKLETVVDAINDPWAIAWLPNGQMLATERRGSLFLLSEGDTVGVIKGVPKVRDNGQGGLLDVAVHPDFAENQLIYLSYSDPTDGGGANTSVVRAKLVDASLQDLETIYKAQPNSRGVNHYGGRLAFDPQNYLFFSVGDRGKRDLNPQSRNRDGGKIYRITEDGGIPSDNPFVTEQASINAIYSLGHRNPQGMAVHPSTGEIWIHEHGPKGGDEVNIIKSGANYGWPILSYGVNYSGTSFAEGTERQGYQSPAWYWDPSIAPSGMTFVTSDKYPDWRGHLLVGSLKFGMLVLCELDGDRILSAEPVLNNLGRVRDVRQGPDGYLYIATVSGGIQRVVPN